MNTQKRSIKLSLVLSLIILMAMGLVACESLEAGAMPVEATSANAPEDVSNLKDAKSDDVQPNEIEVGIEPTPMPETLTYTNDVYGFRFEYPETWSLSEEDHRVILKKGSTRLGIFYRWVNEGIRSGRTGMAAGTPRYSDKIVFLRQVIPVNVVELDHTAKYVLFGENGKVEVDDQVFGIVLEDLESDYMTLVLPETDIADAKSILESFERIHATGSNPAVTPTPEPTPTAPAEVSQDMNFYENKEYGFVFSYPSTMSVVEEPNRVFVTDKANCQMTIAYRPADEQIQISDIGDVNGQLVSYHEVNFLGHPVGSFLNIQDGLITAAFLGDPGTELGEGTPLRFVVHLVNTDGGRIANAQVDQMLMIFESFALAND